MKSRRVCVDVGRRGVGTSVAASSRSLPLIEICAFKKNDPVGSIVFDTTELFGVAPPRSLRRALFEVSLLPWSTSWVHPVSAKVGALNAGKAPNMGDQKALFRISSSRVAPSRNRSAAMARRKCAEKKLSHGAPSFRHPSPVISLPVRCRGLPGEVSAVVVRIFSGRRGFLLEARVFPQMPPQNPASRTNQRSVQTSCASSSARFGGPTASFHDPAVVLKASGCSGGRCAQLFWSAEVPPASARHTTESGEGRDGRR